MRIELERKRMVGTVSIVKYKTFRVKLQMKPRRGSLN
jgi:hypothetical protein